MVSQESSSTEDSSPGSTPKQRCQAVRTLSAEMASDTNADRQNNTSLSRQKLIKCSERPKLKQANSNGSCPDETKGPRGILKPPITSGNVIVSQQSGVKPPVPSRNKVNEMLKIDERLGSHPPCRTSSASSSDTASSGPGDKAGVARIRYTCHRDSGNSSLDSSDPSSSIEWKLSVRSTMSVQNNLNNNGELLFECFSSLLRNLSKWLLECPHFQE